MHNKSRARIYRSQGMPIVPLGHRGLLIVPVDISAASVRIAKVFSAFSVASTHTYDHVLPWNRSFWESEKSLSDFFVLENYFFPEQSASISLQVEKELCCYFMYRICIGTVSVKIYCLECYYIWKFVSILVRFRY